MARDIRRGEPTGDLTGRSLPEFMTGMGQSDPKHFQPFVDVFEEIKRGKKVRAVLAGPRQHGKSTLVLHAIPWLLLDQPRLPIAYATYGQQFSSKQSRVARAHAVRAGVKLSDDHNTIQEWHTEQDGFCLATSIDGPLTGYTVRVGVVDDPFKGRAEAESRERRDVAHAWLKGDLMGCVGPRGSIVIIASRYHEDDLSGRMIREGFDEVRLPAICDDADSDLLGRELGEALCPWGPDPEEPRDLAFLRSKEIEIGPYDWASLMQGRPRPSEAGVFRDAYFYTELPAIRRTVIGFDLAYSATGDAIAIWILGESDLVLPALARNSPPEPILYVLGRSTIRKSAIEADDWIRDQIRPWAGAPMASYVSGPEKGALQALARHEEPSKRLRIQALPARLSKLNRAGRCARRWNRGGIRLPKCAPWADEVARLICGFTGLEGGVDDDADALVSAFDRLTIAESFNRQGGFKRGRRVM